ncbi:MAG: hypothetical protein ACT4PT_11395 [Methanobacteriota archaeon]
MKGPALPGVLVNPAIPQSLRETLFATARRVGLSLGDLELIAQDRETAESFLEAVARGTWRRFCETIDFSRLESILQIREMTRSDPSHAGLSHA